MKPTKAGEAWRSADKVIVAVEYRPLEYGAAPPATLQWIVIDIANVNEGINYVHYKESVEPAGFTRLAPGPEEPVA